MSIILLVILCFTAGYVFSSTCSIYLLTTSHLSYSFLLQQCCSLSNKLIRDMFISSSMEHSNGSGTRGHLHHGSMFGLFLHSKHRIIGQTATEWNHPTNRDFAFKPCVNGNSSTLTKTAKNHLWWIYSLFYFLLNQTVYKVAALFHSCTFVVSVSVPWWKIKLQ